MELYTIITAICIISLSFALISSPCEASHQASMIHSSNEGVHAAQLISTPPALARKLIKFNREVMDHRKDAVTFHKPKEVFSGKSYVQEAAKSTHHAKKGTREEWMESDDTFPDFFTMDYSHVKRRPPIHNKSVPVAP